MSWKPSLVPVLLALALAAAPVPSAHAATGGGPCHTAADVPVRTGAVFNNPAKGRPTALEERLCSLIHQAPPGSLVRMAEFVVSGESGMDFAQEVVAAHRRGVRIQIVIDGWQVDNPAARLLLDGLGTDESEPSWVHVCSNLSPEGNTSACVRNNGVPPKGQHNKFLLFSRTGGARNVVVQASDNLTDLNATTYWNNAVVLLGNTRLYGAYGSFFADMARETAVDDYYRVVPAGSRLGAVRAYFFPRAGTDPSTDTIVQILDGVSCEGGRTSIRVAMSEWETYRIAIAERLETLAARGCSVRIVHGAMDAAVRDSLLSRPDIDLRSMNSPNALPGYVHSKYMLIGGDRTGWVYTGSPNFTQTSLRRNDEAMVRTDIRPIYREYLVNFAELQAAAQPDR